MDNFLRTSVLFCMVVNMLQANVSISSASFQEELKLINDNERVKEWVRADKVVPGTVIRYVNSLVNSGTEIAKELVIKNKIPNNMEYILNTAICQSVCNVSYSIDGGMTFNHAENLFVGIGDERHEAKPSEYTDIRWIIERLSENSQSFVEYKAKLK